MDPIGERLQCAREEAGLTVEDIVFATRIPRSAIVALEAANFSAFSSPLYAKSFLKQYSDHVRVDAQPWLDALQPANFVGSEFVNPLWQAPPVLEKPARTAPAEPSGNGFATAALLVVTCGILYGAYRGYQFFETKFGADHHAGEIASEIPPAKPVQAVQPVVIPLVKDAAVDRPAAPETVVTMRADPMAEPIPRARPVRQ